MGEIASWYPQFSDYPKLNKYIERCEFNRYSTIDLIDYFDEDFYYAFQELEQTCSKRYTLERRQQIQEVAEEMMVKNIRGFKCDW